MQLSLFFTWAVVNVQIHNWSKHWAKITVTCPTLSWTSVSSPPRLRDHCGSQGRNNGGAEVSGGCCDTLPLDTAWQLHHHLTAAVVSAQDQPCQQSTVDWRWLTKHHQQAEELVAVHGCSGREPFSFSAPTDKGPVLHSCSVSNSSDISGHRRDMNTEEELGKN